MNSILSRLLSFLSPPRCPMCGLRADGDGTAVVCASCFMSLPLTGYAAAPYENQMAKMYWGRVPLEKAASLMYYHAGDAACNIVYDMKYHNRPDVCFAVGRMMAHELSDTGFFDDIDVLVPIPLAYSRQHQRGYNQSEEMARGIAGVVHLPVITDAVRRTDFNQSQTHLDRLQRIDNMKDSWKLGDSKAVEGKHVLLVDDVVTTGATTISCIKELQKVADIRISVLSLAYVRH